MRVKAFLFALCSILLLGACGTPKTGGTVYNIMDYGAKGDGVTDDAAADVYKRQSSRYSERASRNVPLTSL